MTTRRRNLGQLLVKSMREAVRIETGALRPARRHRRTVTDVIVSPPPTYGASRVRELRDRLGLSQPLFAQALNASVGTIRGWEQGARVPDGPSRRLLEVVEHEPQVLLRAVRDARGRSTRSPAA